MQKITDKIIDEFKLYLINEEKSKSTYEKYIRDIIAFKLWLNNKELTNAAISEYKEYLKNNYKITSVNSVISSLNKFFVFCNLNIKVKTIKVQKKIFLSKNKVLLFVKNGKKALYTYVLFASNNLLYRNTYIRTAIYYR